MGVQRAKSLKAPRISSFRNSKMVMLFEYLGSWCEDHQIRESDIFYPTNFILENRTSNAKLIYKLIPKIVLQIEIKYSTNLDVIKALILD